ncbi:MAG: right-handed parallel beta-helix repeat-containing protein, partial [Victivallaceae bacterium]|nr:right-handed parallel beta-helix repeat-containing protein [Victivallaceae bacterium]
ERTYVLATGVGNIDQQSFAVTLAGDATRSFTVTIGTVTRYEGKDYLLQLVDGGVLSIDIGSAEDTGIVTRDGTADSIVISGEIYFGKPYNQEQFDQALAKMQTVAAQDVDLGRFEVASGKTFAGDKIRMSGNTVAGNGGAINNKGTATIIESVFTGNSAGRFGGAIYADGVATISDTTISGSTFTDNTAQYGGAVYGNWGFVITVVNSLFDGNTADVGGGGIQLNRSTSVTISGSTFAENSCEGSGAAICGDLFEAISVTGSTFAGNTSAMFGGAIDTLGVQRSTVTITACVFDGNMGRSGGALHNRNSFVTISRSIFSENLGVDGYGGAICGDRGSGILVIQDCVFAGNTAMYGGAICSSGATMTIRDSAFATETDSMWCGEEAPGPSVEPAAGIIIFAGTISLAASVVAGIGGYYYCSDDLTLDFINTTSISIATLGDSENISRLSFNGSETVNFTDLSLAEASISIDCMLPGEGETLTIATGLTSLGTGAITVHGETVIGGAVMVDDKAYVVRLSGNDLVVTSAVKAGIVTPNGAGRWVVIGETSYAGEAFASIGNALDTYSMAAVQGCTFGTQSIIGSEKTAVIDQTEFNGSSVSGNGGAICNDESASISGSTFTGNVADEGGAIYNAGAMTINDSVFATDTDTIYNAGAITLAGTISLAADIQAADGGIYFCSPDLTLDFINTTSISVATLENAENIRLSFRGSEAVNFTSLSLTNASISIDCALPGDRETLTIATGLTSLGTGAIAVHGETVTGGSVVVDGKAYVVYLSGNDLKITSAVEAGVVTPTGTNTVVIDGITYTGAAYASIDDALGTYSTAAVQDCTFSTRSSLGSGKTVVIDRTEFKGSSSSEGGAIYCFDDNKVFVYDSTFSGNMANNGGGVFGHQCHADITIVDSLFSGNTATYAGGAINLNHATSVTISSSTFAENSCASGGGAIYISQSTFYVTDCTFANNSGPGFGGAILVEGLHSNATIAGCVFSNNSGPGGAINVKGSTATISGNTFTTNTSWSNGGAVYVYVYAQVTICNCIFTGNTAAWDKERNEGGGAIASLSGALTVRDSIFATETDSIFCGEEVESWAHGTAGTITFAGTISLAANVVAATGTLRGYYYCSDDLTLDFINTTSISIATLGDSENIQALSFRGSKAVSFTDLSLAEASISIDCTLQGEGETLTIATGLTSLGTGAITVHGRTEFDGRFAVDGNLYELSLANGDLTIRHVGYGIEAGIVTPAGTNTVVIDGVTYTGPAYASINDALGTYSTAAVQDCSFDTRSTIDSGKAAVIDRTEFNGSSVSGNGGAICNLGLAIITGGTFTGNTAEKGGAIYNTGTMTITDSVFATETDTIYNAGAITLGGTISLAADVQVADEGTYSCSPGLVLDFINTTSISIATLLDAENIGRLSFKGSETVNFTDLSLAEASISIDCGLPGEGETLTVAMGLTSLGTGTITVHGETVIGGAVMVDDKAYVVRLSGNDLIVSSAVKAGIVTPSGTARWVVIGETSYAGDAFTSINEALETYSVAAIQGCVFGTQSIIGSGKTAVIDQTEFNKCSDAVNGGAVYNEGESTVSQGIFTGNTATFGGALYNSGTTTISCSTFAGNVAVSNGMLLNYDGGAVYNAEGTASIADCIFTGNSAANGGAIGNSAVVSVSRTLFTGNSAGQGGAISNKGIATISGSTFFNNLGKASGGAVFNNGTAMVSNVVFTGNTGGIYGGAILNANKASLTIDGVIFDGNSATQQGGAVSNSGMASISNATFTGNRTQNGGAVYNSGTMSISDSVFATSTDTIFNSYGNMTFGGTIRTAANIFSYNAITVEPETKLVLDLSVYDGTMTKELVTGFDTVFGTSQSNLTMSIDVAEDQAQGRYVLATDASSLEQREFTVTVGGDASSSFVIEVGETTLYDAKEYTLNLADGTLSLAVVPSYPKEERSVITVPAGDTLTESLHIASLKLLDVKAAGTYDGAILEAQAGKANVKIANDGKVEIIELKQHNDGSLTTIAMKKNATLVVSGPRGMSGVAKLTTGDNSTVNVAGDIVGTTANDALTIGKTNTVGIEGNLDLKDGKNMLKVGANSTVGIGSVSGVQTFTLAAGSKYKDAEKIQHQGRTEFKTGGDITGTSLNKDKVTIGKYSSLTAASIDLLDGESSIAVGGAGSKLDVSGKVSGINSFKLGNGTDQDDGAAVANIGGLWLDGAKKNTLSIGKFGTATIGSLETSDGVKTTVTIGANAVVEIGSPLANISKLMVAAGAKYKDAEKVQQQGHTLFDIGGATIAGTTANDTLSFGNFGTATMGDIDLLDGKDALSIGGQDVEFKAGDVRNISSLKVAAGKSAESNALVTLGDIEFDQVSNKLDIGAFSTFEAGMVSIVGQADPKAKTAVSIGKGADVDITGIDRVSSLKVASGKKDAIGAYTDGATFDVGGTATGTVNNDTWTFGDGSTATFKAIDMGDGDKDKLAIGKSSVVNAGDIVNVEQVTIGDDSTLIIGSSANILGAVTGSAKDNVVEINAGGYIDKLDLGKGDNDRLDFIIAEGIDDNVDGYRAVGTCLNIGNYTINGTEVEDFGVTVDLEDGRQAMLTKNGDSIILKWGTLA